VEKCYVCKKDIPEGADKAELYKRSEATGHQIHRRCIDDEVYGVCKYCGPFIVHPDKELNKQSECKEHAGESHLDPEEQQDFDDLIENMTKDGR
jgi:hypothetical protein